MCQDRRGCVRVQVSREVPQGRPADDLVAADGDGRERRVRHRRHVLLHEQRRPRAVLQRAVRQRRAAQRERRRHQRHVAPPAAAVR